MGTKRDRQAAIKRLARAGRVSTQQELLEALRKKRLPVDQSTLSRDLSEIGVRKVGGRYLLLETSAAGAGRPDYSPVVHGLMTCGPNLIVVSTDAGLAQPVAVAIDQAADSSIVGTLAGDDTIFVATKNRRTQNVALRRLEQWFGAKHER
jgi:transcriptional regulator of arginine metabolism